MLKRAPRKALPKKPADVPAPATQTTAASRLAQAYKRASAFKQASIAPAPEPTSIPAPGPPPTAALAPRVQQTDVAATELYMAAWHGDTEELASLIRGGPLCPPARSNHPLP